jgi:uncharacterized protein (TIGR04255 family)
VYCQIIGPDVVTRLGVRYINRMLLPSEFVDFDKVLTAGPRIPPQMPQMLAGFVNRMVVPLPEQRAVLNITQALEGPPEPAAEPAIAILLDIDAFAEQSHDVGDSGLWETLDRLRLAKNIAFFNSLTPEFLETMK